MGNCYGTPVDNHSPTITNHPTPADDALRKGKRASSERRGSGRKSREAEVENYGSETTSSVAETGKIVTPNLKMFTLAELKAATRNFRPDTLLGEGGFGQVFKGWLDEKTYAPSKPRVGIAVAVKRSDPNSQQGLEEWQSEVKFLGKFSHPNLVKLLGYCWEDQQFLLVYEYMQKGSLESHLFRKGAEPLAWDTRLKIAIGAGQGLAFLHTSEKSVIYRDFKSANILLDSEFNAKLSDFGLAKHGPINGNSHVTTRVMGTCGYAAPEYVSTGHLYVKSDVYGFGVMLLEMLTGLRAYDPNQPISKYFLVDWAKPSLSNKRKLKKIMDPTLDGNYPIAAALQAAELVLRCLESDPKNRPSMEQVVNTLHQIRAVKDKPKPSSSSSSSRQGQPKHQPRLSNRSPRQIPATKGRLP
ncbi:probable serine/threonine-protein kinase PIX13 [Carica papaya]|uniref:probable serine/threonine-protein kinase PIX13 n=1 Tax=Carica papaya TaxID=3649 RepID=UPI000B8C755F|nr:probable serine/threonine-protein kinase PIX13 [Carica papaya]